MSGPTQSNRLPKELKRLREWLEEQRPYKDVTLDEALEADTSVYINPARAMTETGFQDAVSLLIRAIKDGKIVVARKRREIEVVLPQSIDPPVHFRGEPLSNHDRLNARHAEGY